MIICPKCKIELKKENHHLRCSKCGFYVFEKDGTLFFNPEMENNLQDYNKKDLDILYQVEENYFWFKNRKNIIKNLFNKYVSKNKKVIEIGSGTGNIAKMLFLNGYNIAIGEIYENGIRYAKKRGIKNTYQFDITDSPFKEHFDAVGIFDVLEHLANENLVLKNIYQMLRKDGIVIATVPAHMRLWSYNDVLAKHKKRYECKEIKNLFLKNKFKILEAKYFFIFILPLLYLRTILNRNMKIKNKEVIKENFKINPVINKILYLSSYLENILFKYIPAPFGGSIFIVAKKI